MAFERLIDGYHRMDRRPRDRLPVGGCELYAFDDGWLEAGKPVRFATETEFLHETGGALLRGPAGELVTELFDGGLTSGEVGVWGPGRAEWLRHLDEHAEEWSAELLAPYIRQAELTQFEDIAEIRGETGRYGWHEIRMTMHDGSERIYVCQARPGSCERDLLAFLGRVARDRFATCW